ncbi:glutamate--tRNA ligase [Candidatus Saccharibacteria bacterium RIFCSPHIGHO2_12_FULL_41_12]|nr:MAG: glutamate--tRNA ligase [Candidatus Saccharibacteria bacterium RIFCSPHIGHO2_12_FULL_41_12]
MSNVKTRFAPSPTGFLHVGGVRTALFAWLVAKQSGGKFILRIEDTDQAREVQGSVEHIQESLQWLGLEWDEETYFQSKRLDIYKKWADKLRESGRAYADPYTPEQVQEFREQAKRDKQPFLYRNHRPDPPAGGPPIWDGSQPLRLKSNPKGYSWHDEVMGDLHSGEEVIDDFILIKSDGFPTYNFCHIIDDHEMEVTHVIRGQEFLASIPKYLNLYEALAIKPPIMATMPHIMSEMGNKKLSKRDGAKDILDYRDEGYLPEAMINFLTTLGWNDGTEQEIFAVDELIKKFDISKIQKSGAQFDERRLLWLNGAHIRKLSLDDLYEKVAPFWPEEAKNADESYKKRVLTLVQERLKFFAELPELTRFFFIDLPINPELISTHKQLKNYEHSRLKELLETTLESLQQSDFSADDLKERLNKLLELTDEKPVALFSLIRIATTQAPASPELTGSLHTLGKDKSLSRINSQLANF